MLPTEAETTLLRMGVIQPVIELGPLGEAAAARLGLAEGERIVLLHPNTAHHIYSQRGFEDGEAEFVFHHLPRVVREPHFCGADPRAPRRLDLVRIAPEGRGAVFCGLKIVHAAAALSGRDEVWVSTAHRLPENFLSRKRYRDSLRAVEGS